MYQIKFYYHGKLKRVESFKDAEARLMRARRFQRSRGREWEFARVEMPMRCTLNHPTRRSQYIAEM